ncbi:MAG: alpha-ketoglutarate-dependent dioxygenase AlkB [Crocinitomicaceae bacterium]|nr:alpha-ketoglutarate-dependent dioxygenase AlkB [Crocinitomicaceae bacterium]|tara:strand:- start:45 stop:665 length:621 start_codon:yes stop_codon:yes gene_type:complete
MIVMSSIIFYGCEIEVYKSFFSEEYSDMLFNLLKSETEWAQNEIVIFGKKYKIPRLNEWYGSVNMNYSNINFAAKPLTKTLNQVRKNIEKETSSHYNSVLMNLYRNGKDSMGWHSDDENIYNPKAPIASLSLGGSRLMKFKKKTKKGLGKKTLELRLNSGDLIIMKHPTQEMLKHSIPKSSTDIEERINLTFRSVIEKQDAFKTKY